ncbi:GTPase [Thermoplasmatales archaeon ex4572_165]|nr:MAG: GTPase [Thermoplasmatales archaeon ex4572_165]RLF59823.1 MAG: GTPase [Thermoplasmata archaeon]
MKQEIFLYLIGTAGSGKSTLAHTFKQWTNVHGIDSVVVNLDPGAENLPYSPDVDIRDWISLKEIMNDHGLGPNGAQVACADLIAMNMDDVKKSIQSFKTDFVVLDAPGQLELFVFRESGRLIMQTLQPNRSVIGYLIDHVLARTPSGFITQLLLSLTAQYRIGIPQINMLSKADMFTESELDEIISWSKDSGLLETAVSNQKATVYREMSEGILRLIEGFLHHSSIFPVSKEEYLGIDDLYTNIQFIYEGGEDALPD